MADSTQHLRIFRAPLGKNDNLSAEQVNRYLSLLRSADLKVVHSPSFEEDVRGAFLSQGAERLEGPALCKAVQEALKSLPQLQRPIAEEFAEDATITYVLAAFGSESGVSSSQFSAFVRFLLAYRIHCYFETSRLPNGRLAGARRPQVVFVLGGPGAGKGTQCARISATYGYKHLSAGDLLREERKRPGSTYGELIENHIKEGKLVPVEITIRLLEQAMREHGWETGKFLVDGFPRSLDNLEGWDKILGGKVDLKFTLFFECSEACMEARLLERGKTSGRSDDNLESIRKRFQTFQKESMPVVQLMGKQGLLRKVGAERSEEEVWHSVQAIFGPTVIWVLGGPGAGKGTICARLQEFGYKHLCVGDLLRKERQRPGSACSGLIESCMKEGKLVPAEIVVQLLKKAMEDNGWQGGKYLVDGFPKSFDNLAAWDETVGNQAYLKFALYLECSEGVMEVRIIERARASGQSESLEPIRKRFMVFHTESLPVVEKYRKEGLLKRINAEQHIDDVWKDVQTLFGPTAVFVLGGPGAGKGTQCERISDHFGYKHLSAGDLLREERKRPGSEYGELIESYIRDGKLVPVEITVNLLQQAMKELGWEGGKYLIDGFPRSLDNYDGWKKVIGSKVQLKFTLCFDCSEACMEARLLDRGKTSGRSDDNLESIRKRFITFQKESMPVLDMFATQGSLRRIDAERDREVVWTDVQRLFGPTVVFVLGGPGCGKGTQCSRISPHYGFHHLSAGDLLREERKRPGSEFGELIESCIREGKLVPVEITVRLLQKAMEERGWDGKYLIDGFPRSADNMEGWNKVLGGKVSVKFVLFFECSEATMEARLLERGKTSGRSDDNAESIRKRFKTFQEESLPVAQAFGRQGLLRRVSAEQDVEDVWSCVQEVLNNELSAQSLNQAFIILKVHAHNEASERFVRTHLTKHKVAVVHKGTTSVKDILEKNLFDKQYLHLTTYANADPATLEVPQASQDKFRDAFGVSWTDAVAGKQVASAKDALSQLGLSEEALFTAWSAGQQVKLAPSLNVARVSASGQSVFVINGFLPLWRSNFTASGKDVTWLVVEFNPAEVSWHKFSSELLGATNPAEASKMSIRAQLLEHWQAVGLKEPPNTMNNCVHASAGPLEGLRERMAWIGVELSEDPFGRLLLSSGVPQATIEALLENPVVTNWQVGREVRSGKIFDLTEDCDSSAFRDSLVRWVKQEQGGLAADPWTARVRNGTSKAAPATTHTGERTKYMTILHFNDVYNVEPRAKDPVGGISRFVTRMRELKAESVARGEPEAVTLFSGDAFNPSLTSTTTMGRHMITALNAIGIHTACYGNHDFDFGVDNLVEMAKQCNFPWLISNVIDKATGKPLADGIITRMMNFHGRKVGLIGLVEREWLVTLATINPSDVEYEDFCPCARRLAKQLKEQQGAEIVIALTHMRVPNDELLAHEVAEVDIILGGHDHHYDVKPVGPHGTYVLKSGTDFRDITVLRLEFTDEPGAARPFKVLGHEHAEIVASIAEEPEMKAFSDACMAKVGAAMDQVIGESAVDLDCRFSSIRTMETNIGNFVADVMRRGTKTDIAVLNSGTLRADAIIEKGPFKMRDLVNMLPMLDELCILQLTGEQVMPVLENAVSQYPRLEGRFAQVSGISFTFDAAKPAGQRVVDGSVKVGGEPLDPRKNYKLTTKDYLRQGKDGYDVFKEALCLADGETAGILPTLVREYFGSLETLNGLSDVAPRQSVARAQEALGQTDLARVGEGPDLMKSYAIKPQVEGRIVCLNPVA